MEDLLGRMDAGQRALFETPDGELIRVVLPMRPVFRGGRTWLLDHEGRSHRRDKRQDLVLAAALKSAHAVLNRESLGPWSPAIPREAKAPSNVYERKLCGLALLAPDLQRLILEGRQPAGLDLNALIRSDAPLAWADQEAWLERLRGARQPD